jgi:hypothetical protein
MTIDSSKLEAKLRQARAVVLQAMPSIYQEFVKNTPIDQGNARAHTSLHGKTIQADYPYASVLNEGRGFRDGQMRGSEQAPNGMVEPTKQFALKKIAQLIKGIK